VAERRREETSYHWAEPGGEAPSFALDINLSRFISFPPASAGCIEKSALDRLGADWLGLAAPRTQPGGTTLRNLTREQEEELIDRKYEAPSWRPFGDAAVGRAELPPDGDRWQRPVRPLEGPQGPGRSDW